MSPAADVPATADIVVIGGGVVGCALTWHLALAGAGRVALVERDRLGCGTTWHSAANIALVDASTRAQIEFYRYSLETFARLEAETGQAVGWTETGRVQLATNEARLEALRHIRAVALANGVPALMIGPDEVLERVPILRVDDVMGALWTPTSGRVNPTDLLAAYTIGARRRGASILEGAPVTGIERDNAGVSAVVTGRGRIATRVVVNAAGLWAPAIAAMCGLRLPIHATEHFYILTRPFADLSPRMPAFRDADALIYGREEVGGLLLGCFEKRAKPLPLSALPEGFSFGLLPEDWDQFEPYMLAALHRIPALAGAEVKMLLNGPEAFTPDGRFLLGPQPEVGGLFVLAGMNSAGVNNSAGAARALTEIILEGRSTVDVSAYDPGRFERFHSSPGWLAARIAEAPGHMYGHGRTAGDFATGRDLRLSPVHAHLAGLGARFGSVAGWEHPLEVVPPGTTAEAAAARAWQWCESSATLVDATSLGRRLVDWTALAARPEPWAEGLGELSPGGSRSVIAASADGYGLGRAHLVRLDAARGLVVVEAARAARDGALFGGLEGGWPGGGLAAAAFAQFLLLGPAAGRALEAWSDAVSGVEPGQGAMVDIDGAEVLVSRLADSGTWLLTLPSDVALATWRRLEAAVGTLGGGVAGWRLVELDRMARAIPAAGREITPTLPVSALEALAPEPRIVALACAHVLLGGEPVWQGEAAVGFVTSAAPLPEGGSLALACVTGPDGSLEADAAGVRVALELRRARDSR